MNRGLFGPGTIVLGGGAVLMVVLLVLGFVLPTDWAADAEVRIEAPPAEVFDLLDSPDGWKAWTTWPGSALAQDGPERGAGSSMAWSDRELGSGRFTVEATVPDRSVDYAVRVEGVGGSGMSTRGRITLSAEGSATLVRWREEGDLGNNPLMGYWALSMDRMQSTEMGKSLTRLAALVEGGETFGDTIAASDTTTVPTRR